MLLVVKWSYVGNSNGLPTDDEAPLLYDMDEAVDEMLGMSGRWAMTRTGGGVRRSYFYAAGDQTELLNAADRALQSAAAKMPIRFGVTVDVREQPAWDVLREGLAALPPSRPKLAP